MEKKQPRKEHSILSILGDRNFVLADRFFIKTPDDIREITREIIATLKEQRKERARGNNQMFIVGFSDKQLRRIFEAASTMVIEKHPDMEGVDGNNITILQLNAPSNNKLVNKETGITIAAIRKGQPAYPMHPTPAH